MRGLKSLGKNSFKTFQQYYTLYKLYRSQQIANLAKIILKYFWKALKQQNLYECIQFTTDQNVTDILLYLSLSYLQERTTHSKLKFNTLVCGILERAEFCSKGPLLLDLTRQISPLTEILATPISQFKFINNRFVFHLMSRSPVKTCSGKFKYNMMFTKCKHNSLTQFNLLQTNKDDSVI